MNTNSCNDKNCKCKNTCERIKKSATTLDYTIIPQPNPTRGTLGDYFYLQYGPGDKTLVREELACAKEGRKKRRVPLASFIQITDVHVIDAANPSRLSCLAQFISAAPEISDVFRPQEALSLQVMEAMVRKINATKVGPKTGKEISFVISTGDNSDSDKNMIEK